MESFLYCLCSRIKSETRIEYVFPNYYSLEQSPALYGMRVPVMPWCKLMMNDLSEQLLLLFQFFSHIFCKPQRIARFFANIAGFFERVINFKGLFASLKLSNWYRRASKHYTDNTLLAALPVAGLLNAGPSNYSTTSNVHLSFYVSAPYGKIKLVLVKNIGFDIFQIRIINKWTFKYKKEHVMIFNCFVVLCWIGYWGRDLSLSKINFSALINAFLGKQHTKKTPQISWNL